MCTLKSIQPHSLSKNYPTNSVPPIEISGNVSLSVKEITLFLNLNIRIGKSLENRLRDEVKLLFF